jgi:hypothetical protein
LGIPGIATDELEKTIERGTYLVAPMDAAGDVHQAFKNFKVRLI